MHDRNMPTRRVRVSIPRAEKSEKSFIERLRSEGVLLACIPFVGTFIALIFEAGYLSFYEVPITLVQIDFTRVVTATGAVGMFLVLLLVLLSYAADISRAKHPFLQVVGDSLFLVLLVAAFLALIPGPPERWWAVVILFILNLFFQLVPPLFFKRSGESYWQRVASESEKGNAPLKSWSPTNAKQLVGKFILQPVSVLFFGMLLVLLLGTFVAKGKVLFWVMADRPDMVLVANYGDVAIFTKVNLSTKQIVGEMEVTKIAGPNSLKLKRASLGELNPRVPLR